MHDEVVVPDYTEALVGWRRWVMKYDPTTNQPYLASLNQELR